MKRQFALLLAALMLLTTLAGCGDGSELDPKDPVTLTMWHNYGGEMQTTMDLLIDEFNATVGNEKGVVIDVAAISSSADLNKSLAMIVQGDPGAPEMPDIFTGYPKIAMQFQEKGMLVNLDGYFSEDELSQYIDAFIGEGRLSDGGLYVFPIAKSTEILYLNQTLFDEFAAATGASPDLLYTFEGLAELSRMYYEWSGGKQFYAADSWFNVAEVGMKQLGGEFFAEDGALLLDGDTYQYIFNTLYAPAAEGGFAIYDGYSSDLSKTGDLICSTGSSAGILFYGDTVTYPDGTVKDVEYSILPYPVFEGGEKWALQRGGGLMVAKSDEKKEEAAAVFIKWLTAPEQNMRFIEKTGYLPVTKQAFETEIQASLGGVEDVRIKKMLTTVLSMYEEYEFFTAPNLPALDDASSAYETDFKRLMAGAWEAAQNGAPTPAEDILEQLAK